MRNMTESNAGDARPRTLEISKYPNRRYYDKTRGMHLTLEQLHAAIRDGYEVKVTDSKSGQDITAQVLAQIVLEYDAPKLAVFPVELLHRLLRSNQQLVLEFTQKYFSGALSAFLDSQKKTEEYLRGAMGLQTPPAAPPNWASMMWGPFHPAGWPPGAAPPAPSPEPPPQDLAAHLHKMRAQLDELQERLATERANSRRPKKSRKTGKK